MDDNQNLDRIVRSLDDFTEQLRRNGSAIGGKQDAGTAPKQTDTSSSSTKSFERGTDKIVAAINLLNVKISENSKATVNKNKAIAELNKDLEKYAEDEAKREARRTKLAKKEAERLEEEQKLAKKNLGEEQKLHEEKLSLSQQEARLKEEIAKTDKYTLQQKIRDAQQSSSASAKTWDSLSSAGNAGDMLKTKFFDMAGDSVLLQTGLRGIAATADGVIKGMTSFGSSIYRGERGAHVSAKAFEETAKPLIGFVDTLSNVTVGLALIASFVPQLKVFKFALWAASAALTAFGFGAKKAVDFNSKSAEQADRLMKSYNELSKAGGAAADGLGGVFNNSQKLGYTMAQLDDYNRFMAAGSKEIRMFGATMSKGRDAFAEIAGGLIKSDTGEQLEMLGQTAEDQRESTLAYLAMQRVTGQLQLKTAKELAEEAGKFAKELDISATLTGASRKEQMEAMELARADERHRSAMIDARERGDTKKLEILERSQKAAAIAYQMGDKRGATGALHMGAAGGAATTKESIEFMQSYGGATMFGAKGPKSQAEIMGHMAKNAARQQRELSGVSAFTGRIEGQQTDIAAQDDLIQRYKLVESEAKKAKMSVDKYLETDQGKRMLGDKDKKSMIEAGRTQQNAAQIEDSIVKSFGGAATLNKEASEKFNDAVKTFSDVVGNVFATKSQAGGGFSVGGKDTTPITGTEKAQAHATTVASKQAALDDAKKKQEAILADKSSTPEQQTAAKKAVAKAKDEVKLAKSGKSSAQIATISEKETALEGARAKNKEVLADKSSTKEQIKEANRAVVTASTEVKEARGAKGEEIASADTTGGNDKKSVNPSSLLNFDWFGSGSKSNFEQLDTDLKDKVLAAAAEYKNATGERLKINSGKRDPKDQQRLWDAAKPIPGNENNRIGPTGMLVAKPGTSKHESGLAIDIQQGRNSQKAVELLTAAGLKQPYPDKDPVHFEKAKTGGIFSGPSTGYNVELHGDEVVVPASEGVSKQALNSSVFQQDNQSQERLVALFELMIEKHDAMIELLGDGNDHSKKLVSAMS